MGEEYEHRIHRNQHRSNREFAAPHLRDLSQRSEIRVPEKPAPSRLHRVRTQLPAYVLRSFRPGAEFESEHWEHARNDVPACDLRLLRRDGRIAIWHGGGSGVRPRPGMAASEARQPHAAL